MLALVAALALSATTAAPPEEDAARVIDALHAAAASADGEAYFALFTDDARFIGTDATERWTLAEFRAYAAPYFARGQGWTYTPVERTVTVAPIQCRCVAWFDEVLNSESYGVTRGSGVLRKTRDGWKIEQYVLSFAVPNDAAAPVVRVISAYRGAGAAPAEALAEVEVDAHESSLDVEAEQMARELEREAETAGPR